MHRITKLKIIQVDVVEFDKASTLKAIKRDSVVSIKDEKENAVKSNAVANENVIEKNDFDELNNDVASEKNDDDVAI